MMGWRIQQSRFCFWLFIFLTLLSCYTFVFMYISDYGNSYDHRMATTNTKTEMEILMEQITRLYELKDKDIQELTKCFGLALNISVPEDKDSLMVTYKSVDMVSPPMPHFDFFTFLPHLSPHQDSLRPFVLHSRGRNAVSIVFGIPTVRRKKQNYLIQTLISLVNNMNQTEQDDSLIVVMIAEVDLEYARNVSVEIKNRIPDAVGSGLVEVIAPTPGYYPDFSKLRITLGDSEDRVRWRSKQNLDFAFLMMYCQPKGSFYVQLEDDLVARPQYQALMKKTALQSIADGKEWFILDFGGLGFIGKMIKCSDLPWLIQFMVMFYNDKPGDWLLDGFVNTKVCHLGKNHVDCVKQINSIWVKQNEAFFQHIGTWSSLDGKKQLLKTHNFYNKNI
ncbi:alpha-1,3-mannosyl-glycoprotein 4-beta-N-acetylglucosaminyltransferase B-like isoform X2 [Rhopalosiphum padi]|nr:alpha-1,3-mannosyl-glycoprotein 4-beta-N-acetylglucosaminyltransferase B-like isoform X2 [Rhopalosiphum padi]XP_060852859.1 alpha-1,3-mannosyl-glycoprotein 4-beta-N-acetylglucosaminyltransferase B-like isoform X2 [Rhopalosiphum padi]XP_060852860.1 alpha-1,3-mannosyl-glycoprotein 4-beta-N-acetylglucosaminyltransferase B-like isoform X2 [Rhopalosiphum padi]XP_060852861.1 alpha-1,3-mannosyl-glycoprotein 4-beta-N-acetylglucosaminyltransferase B-like isoform X2 [Rhopalosiphum padi]XP_060852862.1 